MCKFLLILLSMAGGFATAQTAADLRREFMTPPDDARIMMRWWWFGPAVTKKEIERELRAMRDGGIGGVEIQPVYPLALDDPDTGFRNLPYLSDEFLDALRFAAAKARELNLRVDVTLGSGWPFGGPHVPVTLAAGKLRCDRVAIPPGAASLALPDLAHGEALVAVFLAAGDTERFSRPERLTKLHAGRLVLPSNLQGQHVALVFVSSRTGQQVKRAAVGAEGFVLDHYDRHAIEHHLNVVGERLMTAFGSHPPYAVFSDSLEVYGSDWTPDLPDEFRKRRGYDLTLWLPALVGDVGPKTADIRRDWGRTLTELAEERYLTPLRDWAEKHGTRFRSQTYGIPPVTLSSNSLVSLPEGEGPQWRSFSTSRWAASAAHLYGRPVVSSETWTWLHSPSFRATPLDMKAEADLHFLQGINQLIGHGWAYSPPEAGEPGWRFYAAAVFNDHNPWWMVMPDITKYLQRVSFILRQGKPANDVALYLPTDVAYASFVAGKNVSLSQAMEGLLGPDLISRILDAGFNVDFVDDQAIEHAHVQHAVLVLPSASGIPAQTARRIDEYRRRGGIVVDAAYLADLPRLYPPDFVTGDPAIGFIHRKTADCDLYFVANTSNRPVHTKARARVKETAGEWWDPSTGIISAAGGPDLNLDFAPYESRILVFTQSLRPAAPEPRQAIRQIVDVSSDWRVTFSGTGYSQSENTLVSWPQIEATRFYSGQAVYEKTVALGDAPHNRIYLDFGDGAPVPQVERKGPGMRAWLEAPVREAAVVSVNDQRAGSVWKPPYRVEIGPLLRFGSANTIRVVVANTAINELAGQALPTYRLLNLRFGERFTPQDMRDLEPLSSGILGRVRITTD